MAFSFGGSSTPAPAPAGGGFSFAGTPAPTPAAPAPGGFSFGGSTPTPAPAAGGFSFGGTSSAAPATPGFGAAPSPAPPPAFGASAPAPAFGAAPSPAPGAFGSFGSTTAPAPAFGAAPSPGGFGSFGSTTAPAPTTGLFGSPAPAPAPFATGFGTTPPQPQQPQTRFSGSTRYADLPPALKQAIDQLHQQMMRHERTMNHVQHSAPAPLLLLKPDEQEEKTKDQSRITRTTETRTPTTEFQPTKKTPKCPLTRLLARLGTNSVRLQDDLTLVQQLELQVQKQAEDSMIQAYHYGKWPTEAIAMRRGVRLPQDEEKKDSSTQLQELLDRNQVHVDRIEAMPSPYLWQTLERQQRALQRLQEQTTKQRLILQQDTGSDARCVVERQHAQLAQMTRRVRATQAGTEHVRAQYRLFERDRNVLDEAAWKELQEQASRDEQVQRQYLQAQQAQAQPTQAPATSSFAAPSPGGGLFGATPAPAGGGLFGSTPAPTTAAAPTTSVFGSTPAFGFGGGTSSTSSKNKKGSSRSSGRLRK